MRGLHNQASATTIPMAHISRRGTPTETFGDLPAVGTKAPGFTLTGHDLADVTQDEWSGRRLVLNIFSSIDTDNTVLHTQLVDDTSHEPDHDAAIAVL